MERGARRAEGAGAADWLDAFFDAYYARRPVNATFTGIHDHDASLPDLSENGAGDTLAGMRALLGRLDGDGPTGPRASTDVESLDLRLAAGFLRIQIREHESPHHYLGNPSLYTGEAVFGAMSLFLSDFAPLPERLECAIERLHGVPELLAQGRANVRSAPASWTLRARRECDGAIAFLRVGIEGLAIEAGRSGPALRGAASRAETAFAAYDDWLANLPVAPPGAVACGRETFSLLLRQGHFVDTPSDAIAQRAEAELEATNAWLREHAAEFGASTPDEALAGLGDLHPAPDAYYGRYGEVWDEIRSLAVERDLVTWPDHPIRFVPRPAWARAAAPSLYFLFYRSPAAFGTPPVHDYLVTPIEADMPPDRRRALLRANNDSVIKLNHVIHHGGIGHHVQNAHARRAASRIGRVAATDCASRIGMLCGGTMAEGWACYATDLVGEHGGLTPLELYAERRRRARMCARAVVDVRLHHGRWSEAEARRFYERHAGLSPAAAEAEIVKNGMFPGTACMYVLGTDAIHTLRRERSAALGPDFSLRAFHDELLSLGSIPVGLAADRMRARAAPSPSPADRGPHRERANRHAD